MFGSTQSLETEGYDWFIIIPSALFVKICASHLHNLKSYGEEFLVLW